MSKRQTIDIWTNMSSLPGGKWLFGALLCWKAPYFSSISPRFLELRPGQCVVAVRKQRKVMNHIGTVHAIAMCNMAELAGGTMTEVTIPATHRWIPKGMTVEYIRKAVTSVVAVARPLSESPTWDHAGNYDVEVLVTDASGDLVFRAVISMWVSPRNAVG